MSQGGPRTALEDIPFALASCAAGISVLARLPGRGAWPREVADLDVELYALTGHKLSRPPAFGFFTAKLAHLKEVASYQGGARDESAKSAAEKDHLCDPPRRFEADRAH